VNATHAIRTQVLLENGTFREKAYNGIRKSTATGKVLHSRSGQNRDERLAYLKDISTQFGADLTATQEAGG